MSERWTHNNVKKQACPLKVAAGLLCVFFLIHAQLKAQDQIFSQQLFHPLQINPALAGSEFQYRASLLHRSQWKSVSAPFLTTSAAFDMRMNKNADEKKGRLGAGIFFLKDKAGDPGLNTNVVNLNLAYHVHLTENSRIGGGMSVGYDQHAVDPATGRWASQYNGFNYDPDLSSGESFGKDRQSHLDLGAGMTYSFQKNVKKGRKSRNIEINAGASAFHLGRIAVAKSDRMDYATDPRFTGFLNGNVTIGSNGFALLPAVYYHRQGSAENLLFGSLVQYNITDGTAFMSKAKRTAVAAGLFCRPGDAFVVKAMFEWSDYAVGIAYDINYSGLTEVSNGRGAVEIALVWRR